MKRVIKASFGLEDDSWMYPDDSYSETQYYEIALVDAEINVDGGAIEYIEPFNYGAIYDSDTGLEILDVNEVQEIVEETLLEEIDVDGTYIVNGVVTIPYTIDLIEKGGLSRRDWEELLERCDFEVLYNQVTFTGTIE